MNIEELARKAHEAHELTLIERFKSGRTLLRWEQEGREHRAAWRAAVAAVLAEVGWRPISEAPEGAGYFAKHSYGSWVRIHHAKKLAVSLGFTHYLPEPEPPAREVPDERG